MRKVYSDKFHYFCKKNKTMKKHLGLLMITLPVMVFLIITSCNNNKKTMNAENKVPAFNLSTIDSTIKPCVDFDSYANGNWKQHNPIPSKIGRANV